MRRVTLTYLAGYLLLGGLGLLAAPAVALRLLFSNGSYGDIMPRIDRAEAELRSGRVH